MAATALLVNKPEPDRPITITPENAREYANGIASFLGGVANVIIQLSHPSVARGVMESTLNSGEVTLHPLKRLCTSLTYVAVADMVNDNDQAAYHKAVNRAHRPVHSKPGASVIYSAFDPNLQLWVAACIYWGTYDLYSCMKGPMEPELDEQFYRYSARLGTTLQMRPEMWPADHAVFQQYWDENLAQCTIDESVRDFFNSLIDLKMLPHPCQVVLGRFHRFVVTALLPQHMRNEMGMTWTERDVDAISVVWLRLPTILRVLPMNSTLADMHIRHWLGRSLV